jgi:hypothetical protein
MLKCTNGLIAIYPPVPGCKIVRIHNSVPLIIYGYYLEKYIDLILTIFRVRHVLQAVKD